MAYALAPTVQTVALSTGVTLPYVEQGDPAGVPVVLLHGLSDSWRSFEPVLPFLPASIRAFALTQRGHGDADRPAAGYHPRDFAADVAAFLDSQGLESAVIAGHSMGSAVALRFALDNPERTRGLVPMGTFVRYAPNPVITEFWETVVSELDDPVDPRVAREFQESTLAQPVPPAFLETVIAESLKAPARVWRDALSGLLEDEHAARLGSIAAPTLLVWGDRDAFVPERDQDTLLATIAGSRLEVYHGTGHAVHWEEPERFAGDLAGFVRGLAGQPERSRLTLADTIRREYLMVAQSLQRIVIDGTELEYEERGSGEPVLLIHGGILADAFAPLLAQPALTNRYRVISYHRRGFAGSARPEGEVSIARQAADARALLTRLGIARAHVVGHSYGGVIALQLAHDARDAVHSLALLEPALLAVPSGERLIADAFAPAIERYEAGDRAGAVATVLRGVAGATGLAAAEHAIPGALVLAATDADTFFGAELPALQAWRFGCEEAREIGQPVLAVQGGDSDTVTPAFGEGIALLREWLPQTEPIVLPGATHGLPFMNPGGLAEALTAFFARHPLPARTRREPAPLANPTAARPVKLVALYGPPTDAAVFERYYAATHVPLARQLPGLERVETALLRGMSEGGAAPYHRIAELWFADMKHFQTAAASPAGQALAADVANFATGGVTVLVAEIDEADAVAMAGMGTV